MVVVVDTGAVVVATVTEGAVVVTTGTGTVLGGLKDAKGTEALVVVVVVADTEVGRVVVTVVRTPHLTTFFGVVLVGLLFLGRPPFPNLPRPLRLLSLRSCCRTSSFQIASI